MTADVDSATPTRAELVRAVASFSRRAQPLEDRKAAAVAIVVIESSGVILTKRARGLRAHAGQWALPGGRLDPGETAVDAAGRELREELGLSADESDVVGLIADLGVRPRGVLAGEIAAGVDAFVRAFETDEPKRMLSQFVERKRR